MNIKRDKNGRIIPSRLIEELENDWEYDSSEDITYLKYENKTFDDFLKTIDIYDYYPEDDENRIICVGSCHDNIAEFKLYDEEFCLECLIDRLQDTKYDEYEIQRILD